MHAPDWVIHSRDRSVRTENWGTFTTPEAPVPVAGEVRSGCLLQDFGDRHVLVAEFVRDGRVGDVAVVHVEAVGEVRVARSAFFQPRSASLRAKGRVALFSAKVEVRGTAPGMLATQ